MGDITGPTASAQTFNLLGSEAAVAYYNEQGGVARPAAGAAPAGRPVHGGDGGHQLRVADPGRGRARLVHLGGSNIIAALLPTRGRRVPLISPPRPSRGSWRSTNVYNNFAHSGDRADVGVLFMADQVGGAETSSSPHQLELPSGDEWDTYVRDSVDRGRRHRAESRVLLNAASPDYAGAVDPAGPADRQPGANYHQPARRPQPRARHGDGADQPGSRRALIVGNSGLAGASIYTEGPPEAAELVHGTHSFIAARRDCEIARRSGVLGRHRVRGGSRHPQLG